MWKLAGAQVYFKKVEEKKWVLIFNAEVSSNFSEISPYAKEEDVVILQCDDIEPYFSQFIYLSNLFLSFYWIRLVTFIIILQYYRFNWIRYW